MLTVGVQLAVLRSPKRDLLLSGENGNKTTKLTNNKSLRRRMAFEPPSMLWVELCDDSMSHFPWHALPPPKPKPHQASAGEQQRLRSGGPCLCCAPPESGPPANVTPAGESSRENMGRSLVFALVVFSFFLFLCFSAKRGPCFGGTEGALVGAWCPVGPFLLWSCAKAILMKLAFLRVNREEHFSEKRMLHQAGTDSAEPSP